ncbi:MAG: UDP-glucose/GDP-mannose dehydrogenase family protein [Micromonosporaceae bacterium]|nr:UDP-glucose/GDP-mannose dehydrogenase family protein [Micromonosporaceae bacterium]
MKITVIGCGHLGATHAAGMADIGHDVIGVDIDRAKVDVLTTGRAWFHEPELDNLLARTLTSGRLRFTTDLKEAAVHGRVHFLAVGTPGQDDGHYDLSQLTDTARALAPYLFEPCLIVGKSTVSPGTAKELEHLIRSLAPAGDGVEVAWNPEFLREGNAVTDTLTPDRIVLGVASPSAERTLRALYAPITRGHGCPVVVTDRATAEMVKTTANAYLATRISFINAVARMCQAVGANVADLAEAIGHDARIGHQYLAPGLGFGGGCLPKDLRAFAQQARAAEVSPAVDLLASVHDLNLHMRQQAMAMAARALPGGLPGRRIAVWGAAFKPGTDDLRDSPAIALTRDLHTAGAQVTVYDPQAHTEAQRALPEVSHATTALEAATGAELIVVATGWPEFGVIEPDEVAEHVVQRIILDARGVIPDAQWRDAGWSVLRLG